MDARRIGRRQTTLPPQILQFVRVRCVVERNNYEFWSRQWSGASTAPQGFFACCVSCARLLQRFFAIKQVSTAAAVSRGEAQACLLWFLVPYMPLAVLIKNLSKTLLRRSTPRSAARCRCELHLLDAVAACKSARGRSRARPQRCTASKCQPSSPATTRTNH